MPKTSSALTRALLKSSLVALALSGCSTVAPPLVVPPKETAQKPDPALMKRPLSSADYSKRVQSNMEAWAKKLDDSQIK